jgi:predicted  nucleic acid-binding Zn-ribbon protein
MDLQDKILSAVLDTQANVSDIGIRLKKVEDRQEKVYDKIDGFMMLISRHEAEIAAVMSKLERLEDRILHLESARA